MASSQKFPPGQRGPRSGEVDIQCCANSRQFASTVINKVKKKLKEKREEKHRQKEEKRKEKFKQKQDEHKDDNFENEQGFQCKVCQEGFLSLTPLLEHAVSHIDLATTKYRPQGRQDELYFGEVHKNVRVVDPDEDESSYEKEGTELWFTSKGLASTCRSRANDALDFFNKVNFGKRWGKRYELVEQGPNMSSNIVIEHINFKAKEKGRRDAPVETFFAQIRFEPVMRVECCVSLGPSALLPHWRKANLGGCKLCNGVIHHPTTGTVDNLCLE